MIIRDLVAKCSQCKIGEVQIHIEAYSENMVRKQFLAKKKTVKCYDCKETVIHNNTPWTMEEVKKFQIYGSFLNSWRGRFVDVYQVPEEWSQGNLKVQNPLNHCVVTVGSNYKNKEYWICIEPYSDYASRIKHADWSEYK